MNRFYIILISVTLFLAVSSKPVQAFSSYVLPYPSAMPGNILYNLNLLKESVLKFWYFGDFGQFTYNLKESDKYLVEAKTLFEYNQYLLALNALNKSNSYFKNVPPFLEVAKKSNKDINKNLSLLRDASEKHIEVLDKLRNNLPEVVEWKPEKGKHEMLMIHKSLNDSITLRRKIL